MHCSLKVKVLSSQWLLRCMHRNFQTTSFQWFLRNMHRNFHTASSLLTLERYVLQLSNCFLLNDSWDIYTATFTLLPSKWLLRYIHHNFYAASFLMTLRRRRRRLYLLRIARDSAQTLINLWSSSWEICTTTFTLLPSKWLLRDMHHNFYTASFLMTLKIDTLQLSHCFLRNESWEIFTATFKLLPPKWL